MISGLAFGRIISQMSKERFEIFERLDELFRFMPPSFVMDGVLIDSIIPVVEEFNRRYGTNYKPGDLKGWNAIAGWAKRLGLSEIKASELDKELWSSPEILIQSPPIPCAPDFMHSLDEQGIKPYFVTSRPPHLKNCTLEWLRREMPWIEESHVCIREDEEISGILFKARKINELQRRIHFEDSLEQAKTILRLTEVHVVLLSYPEEFGTFQHPRLTEVQFPEGKARSLDYLYSVILNPDFMSHNVDKLLY